MASHIDVLIVDRLSVGIDEQDLLSRLKESGVTCRWCDWEQLSIGVGDNPLLVEGKPVGVPRVVLARSRIFTRTSQPHIVFDLLQVLQLAGSTVINSPESIQRSHNKLVAAAFLDKAGIAVPPTRAVSSVVEAGACLINWHDVVFKPALGHAKVGLMHASLATPQTPDTPPGVDHYQEIQLWHLLRSHGILCAQPFIPHGNIGLRLLVIDTRVISCNLRRNLFSNLEGQASLVGYETEPTACTAEIENLAVTATSVLGLRHSSVDIVRGPDGPVVLEVNPMISAWCDLDRRGLHMTEKGIGSAMADMLIAALHVHTN